MTEIGSAVGHAVVELPGGASGSIEISWAAHTNVGLKRAANEDSFIASVPVFAVADGMGGHLAGDRASDAVVSRLAEIGGSFATIPAVEHALRLATDDIEIISNGSEIGVGTTVTGAVLACENQVAHFVVFNIGDSRTYRFVAGELAQVTVDHSLVQELVDAGRITASEAIGHPEANVITRAVGFGANPRPDSWVVPASAGLRLLLCSDGLTGEVRDAGIQAILAAGKSANDTATDLVEAALAHGARDNVTVIVIDTLAVPVGPLSGLDSDTLPRRE